MQSSFAVAPLTKVVKNLIILTVTLWVGSVLVLQGYFLDQPYIFNIFGMTPEKVLFDFWFWQPLTYMFVHSDNIFHVVFNMLVLWMFGGELERHWGARPFLSYYLVSGLGAAALYICALVIYYLITNNSGPLFLPVVGASGAIYAILLAYGILFGDRQIHFMMLFPMKARHFVMLLGGIELLTLLGSGIGGPVANLAHLGGILAGYIYLVLWTRRKKKPKVRPSQTKRGRKLRLVVDNEKSEGPKYWN